MPVSPNNLRFYSRNTSARNDLLLRGRSGRSSRRSLHEIHHIYWGAEITVHCSRREHVFLGELILRRRHGADGPARSSALRQFLAAQAAGASFRMGWNTRR